MVSFISNFANKFNKQPSVHVNDVWIAFKSLKKFSMELMVSKLVSNFAPYFLSLNPKIERLDVDICVALISKSKVGDHNGIIQAITICHGLEFVTRELAEASIPKNLSWKTKGMQVNYLAIADSDIKLIAISEDEWNVGDVRVKIQAQKMNGAAVVNGTITLEVSEI